MTIRMKPVVRTSIRILAAVVATPVIIVVVIAALLYVPAVQNWAVGQVADYVSGSTRMSVSVERVRLRFPLDLGIYGLRVTQPNDSLHGVVDTIADARQLVATVRLRPLFGGRVVVDRLDFAGVKFNTAHFVPSARVRGSVERLRLRSRGVDVVGETVALDDARLDGAHLDVALSDTVPPDTSSTPSRWKIAVGRVAVNGSSVTLHMPGDTLRVWARMGALKVERGMFDLFRESYSVGAVDWRGGALAYDNRYAKPQPGFDFNHIALAGIAMHVDSLLYGSGALRLRLRECAMKEKSGLRVSELSGGLRLDSTHIDLPDLRLRTLRSMLTARVGMDLSTFDTRNPGKMRADVKGYIVKSDLTPLLGFMPKAFLRSMPDTPVTINADIDGNMRALRIGQLAVTYPTVGTLRASGRAQNLMNASRLRADIAVEGRTYNLNFIKSLLPKSAASAFNIPQGIGLKAHITADGPRYAVQMRASEGGGTVGGTATIDTRRLAYSARLVADRLHLAHFLPSMPLRPFSGSIVAQGTGFDFLSPRTTLSAHGSVAQFGYGKYDMSGMKLTADVHGGVGRAVLDSHTPLIDGTIDLSALLTRRKVDARLVCDLVNADFFRMGLTRRPLSTSLAANIEMRSDLAHNHLLRGTVGNIVIRDSANAYRP